MSHPDPNKVPDLETATTELREQLARKSSLFDLLSPPPDRPSDPQAGADKKLRRVILSATVTSAVLAFMGLVMMIVKIDYRSSAPGGIPFAEAMLSIALIQVGGLGLGICTALRLIRARLASLERDYRDKAGTPAAP